MASLTGCRYRRPQMSDAEAMFKDCVKRHYKLNDWEQGFIDSLSLMDDLGKLSPKQYEALEIIWEKVT